MATPPSFSENAIAVFDFDHTLIQGESFWAFLSLVAGWPRTIAALAEALTLLGTRRLENKDDPVLKDHRTFIKAHLLDRLLAGRDVGQLAGATEKLRGWMKWKNPAHQALLDHHAKGHHIVIASGGLDLYLPDILKDLPHDAIICTEVAVNNGTVTGDMISGNCVRHRKAELVMEYMAQNGPFGESWGYGNLPHDLPMLNLMKHRIIV